MLEDNQDGQIEQEAEAEAQSEEQQLEDMPTSEEPAEDSQQESQEELPEDSSERTKQQFEKLKQNNRELKEELERRKREIPSVLDSFLSGPEPEVTPEMMQRYQQPVQQVMPQQYQQPVMQPQMQQPQQPQALVDQDGYVNADVLTKEIEEAKRARQEAERARLEAQKAVERVSRFEIDQETKRLYEEYPELDPGSERFNEEAYELVKDSLAAQLVKTGKRDALGAAKKMSKYFRPQTTPQQQKVLQQRNQVSTQSSSASVKSYSSAEDEDLRLRSRHDPKALYERLARSGY